MKTIFDTNRNSIINEVNKVIDNYLIEIKSEVVRTLKKRTNLLIISVICNIILLVLLFIF